MSVVLKKSKNMPHVVTCFVILVSSRILFFICIPFSVFTLFDSSILFVFADIIASTKTQAL